MIGAATIIRYGPSIVAALAAGGAIWWVMDLRADNARLRAKNASLTRSVVTLTNARDQARDAAEVAKAYAARVEARAAEYEQVKDAFRKGDFNAPLPDDFRILLDGILYRRADD